MKTLIYVLSFFAITSLNAQTEMIWLGGTPGQETNWNQPKNWSTNQVPSEDDWVIIKSTNSGHNAQPIITTEVTLAGLEIQAGATLTIATKGELTIDGAMTYNHGILNFGKITNSGMVSVANTGLTPLFPANFSIDNKGIFALLDDQNEVKYLAEMK